MPDGEDAGVGRISDLFSQAMNDLAGLGKLADSKLAERAYADAVSPAAKQAGQLAKDAVKTFRLFMAPLQLAAAAQDRLAGWLNAARKRVPKARQVEAAPEVAGPAMRAMYFLEAESPVAHLFVNLLAAAIDKRWKNRVHPAFVRVLEQLSPDETLLLYMLKTADKGLVGFGFAWVESAGILHSRMVSECSFPTEDFTAPSQMYVYLEHLQALNVVQGLDGSRVLMHPDVASLVSPRGQPLESYTLTAFGEELLAICMPKGFKLPSKSGSVSAAKRKKRRTLGGGER